MKKEYRKKLLKKRFLVKESRFAPERRLDYDDAMSLVRALRKAGRYTEGRYCLEQICQQIKTVPEPHLYRLNICLDSMDIEAAKSIVDEVSKNFPRDNDVLRNCSRFFQTVNDIPNALAFLDRAIALFPEQDENFAMRGLMFRASGDMDEALKSFGEALKRNPRNVTAIQGRVKLAKEEDRQSLIESVENLLAHGRYTPTDLAMLHYTLADLYENQDAGKQFRHLNEANRLQQRSRPYHPDRDAQYTEAIISRYPRDKIPLVLGISRQTLSPIMVAAMPRSGTTLLERMLGGHSQVRNIGESAAFKTAIELASARGIPVPTPDQLSDGKEAQHRIAEISKRFQENYFVKAAQGARLADKSIANYTGVGEILTVYPRSRIVDLQRHPLDIIYSCYRQQFAAGHNYSFDLRHLAIKYKLYRRVMDYWREAFPEQILSVSYETLVEQPEPVLRQVLEFCHLSWESGCLEFHNKPGVVNTASVGQVRKPLYKSSVYGWEKVRDYLAPAIEELGAATDYQPIKI